MKPQWKIIFDTSYGESQWFCDEEPYRIENNIKFICNKQPFMIDAKKKNQKFKITKNDEIIDYLKLRNEI